MTNGDKIRNMDDKELAKFLYMVIGDCDCCVYAPRLDVDDCSKPDNEADCTQGHLKWLQEEYKGDWLNEV